MLFVQFSDGMLELCDSYLLLGPGIFASFSAELIFIQSGLCVS